MKKLLLSLSLFGALAASAQVPQLLNYQGRITVGGTNYDTTGSFKFALVDSSGAVNYWANDGTASGQPATGVSLAVSKGLYSVLLGDTTVSGMTTAISPSVFANSDVRLRVWFSDGSGYQQLSPDQRIAAVGYALVASTVSDGSVTTAKLTSGAVTPAKIDFTGATTGQVLTYNGTSVGWATPSGSSSSYLAGTGLTLSGNTFSITSGGITSSLLAANSVGSSQLASGAVGSTQLANGAVTTNKLDTTGATSGQVLSYNGTSVAWTTPSTGTTYAAGTGLTLSGNTFSITSGGITSSLLAANSVGSSQLASGAVTIAKLDTTGATSGQVLGYNGSTAAWITPTSYAAGTGLTLSGSTFSITTGGITSSQLAANSVGSSQIASGAVGSTQIASGAVGATQLASSAVTSAKLGAASVGASALDLANLGTTLWKAGGNAGTTAGTHFLGTTDNVALQLHANSARALRLEPNTNGAPNVIAGSAQNSVASGVVGAVIGGGGATNYSGVAYPNVVNASFGTIAGGASNTVGSSALNAFVGGGYLNAASGASSTVGGGYLNGASGSQAAVSGGYANLASGSVAFVGGGTTNTASGFESAIAGGEQNAATGTNAFIGAGFYNGATNFAAVGGGYGNFAGGKVSFVGGGTTNYATGFESAIAGGELNLASGTNTFVGGGYNNGATNTGAVVAGGSYNLASATVSTIGGGYYNGASGQGATVPGGWANSASGSNSLAAGFVASAAHAGAFVWSDSSSTTAFASTAANTFNVRASGGVRFYTTSSGASGPGATLAASGTAWNVVSDRNTKKDFAPVDGREVLRKLDEVPVQSWRYKWDEAGSTPHLGPVAQEFKAAFYPGRDDKSISTLEFDGVELAAIQGLHSLVKEKDAKITALEQRLADLEAKLNKLVK